MHGTTPKAAAGLEAFKRVVGTYVVSVAKPTLRYVQVTQRDLQREFHRARRNAVQFHRMPELSVSSIPSATSDLPGIRRTLATTRHLLEMYRRQRKDEASKRKLQRLAQRLRTVALELDRFATAEK